VGLLVGAYNYWKRRYGRGWGLTWFLAAELMERFHASHGIRAVVIQRDGMGYYGIGLQLVPCSVHREGADLGRLTMSGDVENWVTGSPGDHGLELTTRAKSEPMASLVREAIAHLGLGPVPPASHIGCRHHRRGPSAVLVFQLAARLALRYDQRVYIDNDYVAMRAGRELDPHADQKESPGWTLICAGDRAVVLANDGRVLQPRGAASLWHRFMSGETNANLDAWLEAELGLTGALQSRGGSAMYTAQIHSHRYAAWCSARASGRGLAGSTNTAIRNALEASDLPSVVSGPASSWPSSPEAFDETHRHWCEQILAALHQAGIATASFGRAAKIVAIYLKTRVVCGGMADGGLGQLAHPPIDRLLLQALAREPSFSKSHRSLWRHTKWTELDADSYAEIIRSLRTEGLDTGGFWRVETWWTGDTG
jgi:hypothetical protein